MFSVHVKKACSVLHSTNRQPRQRYPLSSCEERISALIDKLNGPTAVLPEAYGALCPTVRGSTIVAALSNDVRLIVQAPRGNIETIAPRPIVHARVRQLVKNQEYRDAFFRSRRLRTDMSEIVNVNVEALIFNVE